MKKLITTLRILVLLAFCINVNAQSNGWTYPDFPVTLSPEFPKICSALGHFSDVTCVEDYDTYVWTHENGATKEGKHVTIDLAGIWVVSVTGIVQDKLCSDTYEFEVFDLSNDDGTACNDCVPFTPCDDWDDCTFNDQFDENCLCRGTIDFEFEVVRNTPISCQNEPVELTVGQEFDYYEWSIDGVFQSNSRTYTALLPGNYLVEVKNEGGCLFSSEIEILDYDRSNVTIHQSEEFLCNSVNPIELTVREQLENVIWKNDEGVILPSDNNSVTIDRVGIYNLTATDGNGCERFGEVEIKSKFPESKIIPEHPLLCDGQPIDLGLRNLPGGDVSIVWSYNNVIVEGESGEQLTAVFPGTYVAVITDEVGCQKEIEVEVVENNDASIGSVLLDNGFNCIAIEEVVVSLVQESPFQELVNSCDFDDSHTLNNYVVKIQGGQTVMLNVYLNNLFEESCTCSSDMKGLLLDDFCSNGAYSLDEFIDFDDAQDGALQAYIHFDGEGSCLYLKNTLRDKDCTNFNPPDPNGFAYVLNSIICSTQKQENLKLNYLPKFVNLTPDQIKSWRTLIWSGNMNYFDGNQYGGSSFNSYGMLMSNYQYGKELLTSNISFYIYDDDDSNEEICVNHWDKPPTQYSGNYYQIKFEYLPVEGDDDCDNYLTITMDFEQGEKLRNTLENVSAKVDGALANEENDRILRLETVPNCYLDNYDRCTILRDEVPLSESDRLFYNLTDINNLGFDELGIQRNPYEIINCFDDNSLVSNYTNNLFRNRTERIGFLQRLVEIYYISREDWGDYDQEEMNFRLEGENQIMGFEHSWIQFYWDEDYFLRHNYQELFGPEFIQEKSFDYFDLYEVKLDSTFNHLHLDGEKKWHKDRNKVNHKVPGIYVAWAIEKWQFDENQEDIQLAIHASTILVGIGQVTLAAQTGLRLSAASATAGVLDIGSGAANIILGESAICNHLGINGWCDEYKKIAPILDIIIVSGGFAAVKLDDIIAVKYLYGSLNPAEKAILKSRIVAKYDQVSWGQFDNVFTLNTELVSTLKTKFPLIDEAAKAAHTASGSTSGYADIFLSLVGSNVSANRLLELEVAIKGLDNLIDGSNGYKFVDDLLKSSADITKIGHHTNLSTLTASQVKAWKILDDAGSALKADVASLSKLTNWVDNGLDEAKLATALKNSNDPDALFNSIDNAKSIYHQRVYINDYDNIPGLTNGQFQSNALGSQAQSNPPWGSQYDLQGYRTETFTGSVTPDELAEGSFIYRVTDDGGEYGGFWTATPPNQLTEVIGGTAVQPGWNGFSKIIKYEVPSGGLKVWRGPTANQPLSPTVTNPHLAGGLEQIYVPDVYRFDSQGNKIQSFLDNITTHNANPNW